MPEKYILAVYTIKYRRKYHQSQEVFADNCGISKDYLSLIERERANPSLETLQHIASYTGDTVAIMLTAEGDKTNENS